MGTSETQAAQESEGTLGLELGAGELVRALLGLEASRRLHLLDSGGARGDEARLLVAGFDPCEVVEAFGEELRVWRRGEGAARVERGSALALLDERLSRYGVARATGGRFPLRGACVATLSYELARQFERRRGSRSFAERVETEPDAVLAFFDVLVVHDYASGETRLVGVEGSDMRMREARETLRRAAEGARLRVDERDADSPPRSGSAAEAEGLEVSAALSRARSNMTRAEYVAAVERVREYIYAGDIYQANLTQRISCALAEGETPERVFLRLRREHPASFAAFIRRGASTVVSASPERFLRVSSEEAAGGGERIVEAWPIKGTRRRGATLEEDARLRAELLASGKDAAENIMIVDLMRNDLGRVCRYGSVEVSELCALQEHPTLFHLVSKVRGRLREGVTAGELLRAAFPCGSITGAPKIRAMEIISEVERAPRGVSMGAIGYFSFDGALDLNVAIRTVTFDAEGSARFNVGGGVVAESDAGAEYEESLLKARALLRALRAEL
ncbi:MAG TPA: aminodeoxychorismate synthase component I [Pyrinomonadaceae bacterium]|nr:aminodeoxychorismate synthase component I [Pyrinomonadaceae bacterium]